MSKANVCKVCGKDVEYWSVPKNNGKTRFYAFHVGDAIPEGSIKFEPDKISGIHKMRRRKELEEVCANTSSSSSSGSDGIEPTMEVVLDTPAIVEESPKSKPKDVILPKKKVIAEPVIEQPALIESHEIPAVSIGKPVLEIDGMKRNRFAITGAICRTMTNAGMTAQDVTEARSVLINQGKDFPSLIIAAAPYVQVTENGHPLSFI